MDIYCRVTPYGLVPLYDSDHDLKQRLRIGSTVRCRISQPRNYEFHKKFFALVRLTYDNLPLPLVERWNVRSVDDMLPASNATSAISQPQSTTLANVRLSTRAYRSRLWMNNSLNGSTMIV